MFQLKNLVIVLPLVSLFFTEDTFAHRGTLTKQQQSAPDIQRLRTPARQPIASPRTTGRAMPTVRTSTARLNRSDMHRSVLRTPTTIRRPLVLRVSPTRTSVQAHRPAARPASTKSLTIQKSPQKPDRFSNSPRPSLVNRAHPSSITQTSMQKGNLRTLSRKGPKNILTPQPTPQDATKTSSQKYTVTFQEMPLEYQAHVREKCAQKGCPPPAPNHPVIIPHHSVKDVVHRCLKDLETSKPHLRERIPHIKQGLINTFESKGYR